MRIKAKHIMVLLGFMFIAVPSARAMGSRPEMMTEYTEASQGTLRFYLQKVLFRDSLGRS